MKGVQSLRKIYVKIRNFQTFQRASMHCLLEALYAPSETDLQKALVYIHMVSHGCTDRINRVNNMTFFRAKARTEQENASFGSWRMMNDMHSFRLCSIGKSAYICIE